MEVRSHVEAILEPPMILDCTMNIPGYGEELETVLVIYKVLKRKTLFDAT